MDQQFSLSWNNFHGNLSEGFAGLLGKKEFVDVTIAVEGHLIQAHKVILSICSPYFKEMFNTSPCQHPIVVLRDVSHKIMKDLLQFMYQGEVSVKREDLTSFIGTAELLQIKGLTNKESDETCDKEQDLVKHKTDTQNSIPSSNSGTEAHDDIEDSQIQEQANQHGVVDLLNQKEFSDRLQRFNNMKRKSEEFVQKNYYNSEIFNFDKRPKLREKIVKHNSNIHSNNYDQFRSLFHMNSNIATNYSMNKNSAQKNNEENESILEPIVSPESLDIKTECDDGDIIVTEPGACTSPKSYATREGQKDMECQPVQDKALSLVGRECEGRLPARYKYIYSRKGHKQLVHLNFVYTKHSTSHGKTSWRCVQYFSLNRCPATVETVDAMIYAVNHQHNHEDCYEKLSKNSIYEMNFEDK